MFVYIFLVQLQLLSLIDVMRKSIRHCNIDMKRRDGKTFIVNKVKKRLKSITFSISKKVKHFKVINEKFDKDQIALSIVYSSPSAFGNFYK